MDLIDYLHILRRRWPIVIVPVLLGLTFAWLTTPEANETVSAPLGRTYTATATVVFDPNDSVAASGGGTYSLDLSTVSLFVQLGEIPKRAARELDYPGEPQELASQVRSTANPETNSLQISASDQDGTKAARQANAFAAAAVSYFHDQRVAQARAALRTNQKRVDALGAELQTASSAAGGDDANPAARSKVEALQPQYTDLLATGYRLRQVIEAAGPLKLLQQAVPVAQEGSGLAAPTSPLGRISLAGLLALMLGLVLALVVDRFDTRLRSRRAAEVAFGLPVLAAIPSGPRTRSQEGEVTSSDLPSSEYAEAYRELRSATMLLPPVTAGSHRLHHPGDEAVVILVTSPRRQEGRSTVVANLAAVMAETGQQVLVLSMDLRNPAVERMLGAQNGAGLAELTAPDSDADLLSLVRPCRLPGVDVVTAGSIDGPPKALLIAAERIIGEARRCADIVLIDSPAALQVADAGDLAQFCDLTILVARQNRTSAGAATEVMDRFERLNIEPLGVVLVGADRAGGSSSRPSGGGRLTKPSPVDQVRSGEAYESSARTRVSTRPESRGIRKVS